MSFTYHSSYSLGELSSRAAASTLLSFPPANILVPSLSAPFLNKYLIESLRVKCRFVLHTPDLGFLLLLTPESGLWFELQTWSFSTVTSPWGQMRIQDGNREVSGSRMESVWHGCCMREETLGQWSGSLKGMSVWEPAVSGREVTGNHGLPIFVRLSSSLSEWSCLILFQFCNSIGLPLLIMRRQGFLTPNADGRDFSKRYRPE